MATEKVRATIKLGCPLGADGQLVVDEDQKNAAIEVVLNQMIAGMGPIEAQAFIANGAMTDRRFEADGVIIDIEPIPVSTENVTGTVGVSV